jgi:hypothetical protein
LVTQIVDSILNILTKDILSILRISTNYTW